MAAITEVAERLDRIPLSGLHLRAAMLCAVGLGIDLIEIAMGNALSAVFSAPPHGLAPRQLSWLLASVYAGAAVGAPFLGWAADRRGVQRMLSLALLWIGLTSALAAFSPNPACLAVFRFLSGIALGAYPPLMIAYLTAIAPPRRRGVLIYWVCALAYLAPPGAVFLVRALTPLNPFGIDAWRWPFGLAGVLSLLTAVAFLRLPEAPHWVAANGPLDAADACGDAPPAARPPVSLGRRFAFTATLYVLHPWATVAFPLLTGPILIQRGFDITKTLLFVGIATVGPALGALVAGLFVDRVGRRVALTLFASLMLLMVVLFFSSSPRLWMIAVVGFGIGVALYSPAMTVYGAEIFPSASRARATSTAWALNRVAAALVPVVLLPLLHARGAMPLTTIICVALLGGIALVTLIGPPGAAGRSVE